MNTADVVLTPYTGENNNHSSLKNQAATRLNVFEEENANDMMLSESSSSSSSSSSTESEESSLSPVSSYFTTDVRVKLTCDSCRYTRTHKETFWHLSLEIGSDSGSVEDGLRRFFAPERREIKCEKCFCATATQTTEILKLPRALLLHFKRFLVDVSPDYTSISYRKNRSPVVFDTELPLLSLEEEENNGDERCFNNNHNCILSEFMAPDCVLPQKQKQQNASATPPTCGVSSSSSSYDYYYRLRSVVNHIGSSASCGHYTADANRFYSKEQECHWTRFNDEYVSRISPKEALEESRHTAYMVMYELT